MTGGKQDFRDLINEIFADAKSIRKLLLGDLDELYHEMEKYFIFGSSSTLIFDLFSKDEIDELKYDIERLKSMEEQRNYLWRRLKK